jgi:hypothetical protein
MADFDGFAVFYVGHRRRFERLPMLGLQRSCTAIVELSYKLDAAFLTSRSRSSGNRGDQVVA